MPEEGMAILVLQFKKRKQSKTGETSWSVILQCCNCTKHRIFKLKKKKPNSYSTPLKTTVLIQCIRNCLHGQYLFDWVCILFIQENCITLRINCILYQTFCGILLQLCYFSVYSQHSGLCDIWRLYQKDCHRLTGIISNQRVWSNIPTQYKNTD